MIGSATLFQWKSLITSNIRQNEYAELRSSGNFVADSIKEYGTLATDAEWSPKLILWRKVGRWLQFAHGAVS